MVLLPTRENLCWGNTPGGKIDVLFCRYWVTNDPLRLALYVLLDAVWRHVNIPPNIMVVTLRKYLPQLKGVSSFQMRIWACMTKSRKLVEVWRTCPAMWGVLCDADLLPTHNNALWDMVNFLKQLPPEIQICVRFLHSFSPNKEGIFWLSLGLSPQLYPSYYVEHYPTNPIAFRANFLPHIETRLSPFKVGMVRDGVGVADEALGDAALRLNFSMLPPSVFFPPTLVSIIYAYNPPQWEEVSLPSFVASSGASLSNPQFLRFVADILFKLRGGGA